MYHSSPCLQRTRHTPFPVAFPAPSSTSVLPTLTARRWPTASTTDPTTSICTRKLLTSATSPTTTLRKPRQHLAVVGTRWPSTPCAPLLRRATSLPMHSVTFSSVRSATRPPSWVSSIRPILDIKAGLTRTSGYCRAPLWRGGKVPRRRRGGSQVDDYVGRKSPSPSSWSDAICRRRDAKLSPSR